MFNKRHVALQDGHILWGEFRRNYPIVLKKKKKKKKRAHTVVRYSEDEKHFKATSVRPHSNCSLKPDAVLA